MRIGFDLDGVLADLHTPFARMARELFPELDQGRVEREPGVPPPPGLADEDTEDPGEDLPPPGLALSRRQADAVWRAVGQTVDFWETLGEIESGAIRRLALLADTRRWEVIFLTSRPRSAGRTVQRQSQRWLERLGFSHPSAFVVHGSRGRIAQALDLDAVVDDRPDNCLDVALESKAGAILVWRGTQQSVPTSSRRLGIAVVPSVNECLDALVAAEEAGTADSLLARLRRVFGLRTKPASPFGR
ncbi:MAG TPA: hypothetical protein VMM93_07075 [Vicinamibacterales bacterium]|nr:hypothetical protein [Vicinamibacterales bacterium]